MGKPTYSTSTGERLTTREIDIKMQWAKAILLDKQLQEHGYNFCQTCNRNDCKPITCAHVISVKEAKETGRAELCYNINNMVIEGVECHKIRDGLDLKFNEKKRKN